MLKEFVDKLEAMACRAGEVMIHDHPDPFKKLVTFNGGYDVIDKPRHRAHAAHSLETIAAFANPETCEIWYSTQHVTCFPESAERINRLVMDLCFSKPFQFFIDLEVRPRTFSQRDLIFTLRTTLAKCQSKCPNFLKLLRELRFNVATQEAALINHGKTSVGKTIQREATGQDAIPEEVVFTVPVYADKVVHYADIECAVEVDPGTQTIQLVPLPGQIESVKMEAEAWIAECLTGLCPEGVPIYHGIP